MATKALRHMPNIATVFKSEISRLARKELRNDSDGLRKIIATQRSEVASLKRRVRALEATVKKLSKMSAANESSTRTPARRDAGEVNATGLRFRAAGMAANRKRLGLSAADFGLLVGATGQSIYAWEAGKAKPRAQALAAIAALRGIGKREAEARLEQLKA
jgi:DNA-binding transcriptional regulator YiaG